MKNKKLAPDCANSTGAQIEIIFNESFSGNRDSVKPLEIVFSKGGFDFEQIARTGSWAVYRKRDPLWPEDRWSYEVIFIKVRRRETTHGRDYPAREVYPSSESWGIHGFTFTSEEVAMKRLQNIAQNPSIMMKRVI